MGMIKKIQKLYERFNSSERLSIMATVWSFFTIGVSHWAEISTNAMLVIWFIGGIMIVMLDGCISKQCSVSSGDNDNVNSSC